MPSNILIFPTSLESFPFAVGKYNVHDAANVPREMGLGHKEVKIWYNIG